MKQFHVNLLMMYLNYVEEFLVIDDNMNQMLMLLLLIIDQEGYQYVVKANPN